MIKIAVFASGEGTNLQALIDATKSRRIHGEIALVVSSHPNAGALKRAQRAGIPHLLSSPKDFSSPSEYSANLSKECKSREIGLICLAGFLFKLEDPILKDFQARIMNIHPALLPSHGGKGMYGRRVHEAVLESGARVSGCTVHFVDEEYDHGPIITQSTVSVLEGDTPETLAARVRAQEHWAYPRAVALFCADRLETSKLRVKMRPSPLEGSRRVRRALISVADKAGLIEFARGLEDMGVEIVSTSGTAKALREAGITIRSLDTITGYPEILSGRVKTLHPQVHGGILLRRGDPAQKQEAEQMGIEPIDLVAVNLYPFAKTAAKASSAYDLEVIEQIDIGGVALIRAAAKNFEDVAVIVSPNDYAQVLKEMEAGQCQLAPETRRNLALAAFRHTAAYDKMISSAWGQEQKKPPDQFPENLTLNLKKLQDLRYGENPHQRAALYTREELPSFKQLQGKELSYNNLMDAHAAWENVSEFHEPAAVMFKHATPCGVGSGKTQPEAFKRAWACDSLSAFGSILALNRPLTPEVAEKISERFMEVIVAPGFPPEVLEILKKKKNLRLLERRDPPSPSPVLRTLGSEVLLMDPDRLTFGQDLKSVTKRSPSKEEEEALRFAWICCKHVKSNAIVLAGPRATVGLGAGQMSRVDAVHIAGTKYAAYRKDNPAPPAFVLASDAFFPFRDGIDEAAKLGITAVIQPGGSVKDPEVIAAADESGLAMVFTGMRHFRH